jgi:hypothetical protein
MRCEAFAYPGQGMHCSQAMAMLRGLLRRSAWPEATVAIELAITMGAELTIVLPDELPAAPATAPRATPRAGA